MIETVGYIDRVAFAGDEMVVDGWVAAAEGEPIDSVTVTIAGQSPAGADPVYGIESSDVQEVHPHLVASDRARFCVRVPAGSALRAEATDQILIVTPWITGEAGHSLYHVVEPTLPKPGDENIEFVGGGFNVAYEFLGHLVQRAGLSPSHDVLDVGCGTGRIAYALAYYLESDARYEGFDIADKMVRWAQETITPRHPNFRFLHANIYNGAYNPEGSVPGRDFVFPYEDASMDRAFLTSVFTHMRGDEVRHYLDELRRVLRPGGRCLATCFLLDAEARRGIAEGRSAIEFGHRVDEAYANSAEVPESVIGFDAEELLGWVRDRGFSLMSSSAGWWSGRHPYTSYQDILVLGKG
jgi:SAM-dependent methyltransferase